MLEPVTSIPVTDMHGIVRQLRAALDARSVAATTMNAHSSRAHTLFQLHIVSTARRNHGAAVRESTLTFVDLAGSERLRKDDDASGARACVPDICVVDT